MVKQAVSNCFLIDDDIDDHEIFAIALRDADLQVNCTYFNDPEVAIKELKKQNANPGCIFIDMNMPRMSGIDCLEEIRKIEHLKNVPIYMYSTASDPYSIQKAKELGVTDVIDKPAIISTLAEKLQEIFGS